MRQSSIAIVISIVCAALLSALSAGTARADDTQYYFLVDDIQLTDGVPDMVEGLIRKQADKTIRRHPRLIPTLPEDAPDPKKEPAAFEKYVKRTGLEPYGVRVEITNYDQEIVPRGRGRSGNYIKVSISMRVLGVTLSKSTFGFTGEGSASIKAEAGKKVRKRDIKFTNQDAVELAVDEAMAMAIKRLDEKRANFKKKFRKKKAPQTQGQEKAPQEEKELSRAEHGPTTSHTGRSTRSFPGPLTGPPAIRGVALGLYPDGSGKPDAFDSMIDEIADLGASDIALVVTWGQADIRATRIAAGKESIDDRTVRHAIAHAHKRGLRVLLFPILTVRKLRPGQWRGTLNPRDRDAWWQSYEAFILHYAAIAADSKASSLLIGSELATTESWMYRWYHLISEVRQKYTGALVYSANWDHFHLVSFWRRLDVIGVTGYFSLTDRRDASVADLKKGWQRARQQILDYARDKGKALWLTEVGYTSVDGTAVRPWDYRRKGRTDHDEQRRCYQAFIDTWDGVALLDGVFVWNWYGRGGKNDRSYTPKGKPAEKLLRAWYRGAP